MQRERVVETVLSFLIPHCSSYPPYGLQVIACDPPPAGRKLGSFFLLDPAFISPKSQYAND